MRKIRGWIVLGMAAAALVVPAMTARADERTLDELWRGYMAIVRKMNALGEGFTGGVVSGLESVPNGFQMHCQNCSIYALRGSDIAYEVHGAIRVHYHEVGGPWRLGLPTTDEWEATRIESYLPLIITRGRGSHFQAGSIYWTPQTGAMEVHGAIRDEWARQGWQQGPLGFPTSDERGVGRGTNLSQRYSDFQNGVLYWENGNLVNPLTANLSREQMKAVVRNFFLGMVDREQIAARWVDIDGVTDTGNPLENPADFSRSRNRVVTFAINAFARNFWGDKNFTLHLPLLIYADWQVGGYDDKGRPLPNGYAVMARLMPGLRVDVDGLYADRVREGVERAVQEAFARPRAVTSRGQLIPENSLLSLKIMSDGGFILFLKPGTWDDLETRAAIQIALDRMAGG